LFIELSSEPIKLLRQSTIFQAHHLHC